MKRCGLVRRISLRDSYARKQAGLSRGKAVERTRSGFVRKAGLRKTPLRKVSRSLARRLREYFKLTAAFLARPENTWCWICDVRREHGENICRNQSTEVHHHRGRAGRLLTWIPGFRASCRGCREWPHQNQKIAREWGVLAPAAQFNVFPEGEK